MVAAMETAAILSLYDETVRRNPPDSGIGEIVRTSGLIEWPGDSRFISAWPSDPVQLADAIAALTASRRNDPRAVVWRLYDRDDAADLAGRLEQLGFQPTDRGTFMVRDLLSHPPAPADATSIRRVQTEADLDALVSITASAFGEERPLSPQYRAALLAASDRAMLLSSLPGGRVAGAASVIVPRNCPFALMLGAGVLAETRGKGLYRALVEARLRAAREASARFAAVDAGEMSRPILARMGFQAMDNETTWVLAAA